MPFIIRGADRDAVIDKAATIARSIERSASLTLTFHISPDKSEGWQMTITPFFPTHFNKDLSHAAWRRLKRKFSVNIKRRRKSEQ
jgi:hypothetical protein